VACDSRGTLHRDRRDVENQRTEFAEKWTVCLESNPRRLSGGI